MRQIFVHIHIPKCGGTSVSDFLSRNFGPYLGNTNGLLNDYQYNSAQVARIIDHYPELKCLTGHKLSLDLPFYREDLEIHAFTWIRDPVERFVSHYFYHRNHTNIVPEAKSMSLPEYTEWALKDGNQKMYINGQTRFISGGSLDLINSAVKDKRLILFPLSRIRESFITLAHQFPEVFIDTRFVIKNISKKDQNLPNNFRENVLPYVEEDMRLLELAEQTKMECEGPHKQKSSSGSISRSIPRAASLFLHRIANFIEKRHCG